MPRLPTLVSLGAGPQQLPLVEAGRRAGLSVVTVDRNPEAPGHARATHPLVLGTHEPEPILARLADLATELDVRGVVCRSTGRALETQVRLADAFDVPGPTAEAVRIATSKSELRRFCAAHRLPMPDGVRVPAGGFVGLELPLVVKPDYTVVGKRDVRRIVSRATLPEAIAAAAASSWNGLVEVEAFVDGVDVACVLWARGGRAHALALYDEVLGFASDGSVVPVAVSAPTLVGERAQRNVIWLAERFAAALPRASALLILCVRVDALGAPHVIELHADLGGDRIADELLPASMPELDYFGTVVDLATGGEPPRLDAAPRPVALLRREGAEPPAPKLLRLETRDELLRTLAREVARLGSSVVIAPPVLRLAA